jgi:branched-chain amino acid transport system substrate-binding protein
MTHLSKRRLISMAAFGVAVALALTGCSSSKGGASSKGGGAITLGLVADLSGPTADLGKGDKLAAELAVADVNKSGGIGGRNLKLITYDDQGAPAKTSTTTTRLAYNDKVSAIICSYSSSAAAACAAIAAQAKVPMITSATVTSLTDKSKPWYGWLFRSTPNVSATVQFMSKFVVSKVYKSIAISHSSLAYGTDSAATVKQNLSSAHVKVTGEASLEPAVADASTQAAQLMKGNPDAIVSFDYPSPTAQVILALRSLGYTKPIITNQSGMNQSVFAIAGAKATNLYAVDSYDPKNPEAAGFNAEYKASTGEVPWNYQQGYEYANVQVLANALKSAKSTSGADVKAALESTNCVKTIIGRTGSCVTLSSTQLDGSGPETQLAKYLPRGSAGTAWQVDPFVYTP